MVGRRRVEQSVQRTSALGWKPTYLDLRSGCPAIPPALRSAGQQTWIRSPERRRPQVSPSRCRLANALPIHLAGDTAAMAAGHLAGGHDRADMTQELVRYVLLAAASATVAGVVFEALRRRVAGTRLDRQLREQHLRPAHLNRIRRVPANAGMPIGIDRVHRDAPHLVGR